MRFITVLILLIIPSLSYGMSKDERIKALEEKVELLNEHAEEFKKDFLTDIKERKLMES